MKRNDGSIMLEGMLVTVITLLMLVWILGIGFVYYQKYLVTIVSNDVATKISAVYYNTDTDIVMGYIETDSLPLRNLYRDYAGEGLERINTERAQAYVNYNLNKMNFSGVLDGVEVNVELINDSILRKHVEVTTVATFKTPFLSQFNLGTNGKLSYQVVSRADCTDISGYITNVDFLNNELSLSAGKSSVVTMINSLIKIYNHIIR